ncbi:MAG: hypothetical protein QOK15_1059 [Nocardioidaceae bacterium]|nr:hypothetical protein [Nocardioidaceae bacterium]
MRGEDTEAPARVESVFPVFVDGTGRRRRFVTLLGWLVAVSCVAYLGVIGISMSGTSVGPLPEVPSVASNTVVFGSEVDALPQGALESPVAVPAVEPQAPAPVVAFANPVKKATQPKTTTAKSATSKSTASSSPVRMRGTSQ